MNEDTPREEKWPLWDAPYRFWRAPFKAIRYWIANLIAFFHRGRYGWSPMDVWNMDQYLGLILPAMLRHLADNHCGHPMEFIHPEDTDDGDAADVRWTNFLKALASKFEFAAADSDKFNPYYEDWSKTIFDKDILPQEEKEKIAHDFYEEHRKLAQQQDAAIKEACETLGKYWWNFWD